jgi:hypothetical protein
MQTTFSRVGQARRLPDDDRAGANDQDGMNVGALRHKSAGNKPHSTPVVSFKVGVSCRYHLSASSGSLSPRGTSGERVGERGL